MWNLGVVSEAYCDDVAVNVGLDRIEWEAVVKQLALTLRYNKGSFGADYFG